MWVRVQAVGAGRYLQLSEVEVLSYGGGSGDSGDDAADDDYTEATATTEDVTPSSGSRGAAGAPSGDGESASAASVWRGGRDGSKVSAEERARDSVEALLGATIGSEGALLL